MKKVFVPNKSGHDFSSAEKYGKLIFLTEGRIHHLFALNSLYRTMHDGMKDAEEGDYLLVSSLSTLNSIATGILVQRFSKVNYLLFSQSKGEYVERNIDFSNLD